MCKPEIRKCLLKFLGANMTIVAPLTVALGIADLVLSIQAACVGGVCAPLDTVLALSYVAVGIWAPIPIFFNGLGAIWISNRPNANNGWLCLLSLFNTIAFAPVIVIVTALEVSTYLETLPQPVNLPALPQQLYAMVAIEITIAVIGGVLFLHALAILYLNCCCRRCLQEEMEYASSPQTRREVYVSGQQTTIPIGGITRCTYPADVKGMNIWSAYR